MKAVRFNVTLPRYALGLALGKYFPRLLWSGLSCTSLDEVPEPELPGEDWVLVKTRYGGICGSDTGTIHLHTSPYFEPLNSFPYTFGHENTGTIAQTGPQVQNWQVGERVVVEPTLWCEPRGFAPEDWCRYCARGEVNRCENLTQGKLAPGLMTGICRDTGGSWSPYYLAHVSQLYRVPDEISDENALMVEPFAVGLHAALQNFPADHERVMILGAGTIGLTTLAALRALGSPAEIIVLARYPFQAEAAQHLGASRVISADRGNDYLAEVAGLTGAQVFKPIVGKRTVLGGVDRIFECVGSDSSLDDALRMTQTGGKVILVGVPGIAKNVDWTAIFAQELDVRGVFTYHNVEPFAGKTWRAFDLVFDLMQHRGLDLGWMVTHEFGLEEYDKAFSMLNRRGQSGAIKAVFAFED